jgi:hypothetical protein
MKRTAVILVVLLALVTAGAAYAITNGEPDAGRHPYVALLIFGVDTPEGFIPGWRCSGALINENVVLTAGHCTDGADSPGSGLMKVRFSGAPGIQIPTLPAQAKQATPAQAIVPGRLIRIRITTALIILTAAATVFRHSPIAMWVWSFWMRRTC